MIAINEFAEPQQSPSVFYININSTTNNLYGDCTNCGEKQVPIFEHDCEEADQDACIEQMVQVITKPEGDTRTLLATCVAIISFLVWIILYV